MDCEFVNYFKEKSVGTKVSLNIDRVYTLGSVHCISHDSMCCVDELFGDAVVNVIDPNDPIPRMLAGNRAIPTRPIKTNKRLIKRFGLTRVCINEYAQCLLDNHAKVASFGPIGTFLIFIGDELRTLSRYDDGLGVFDEHLVHGAKNYTADHPKWCTTQSLYALYKYHTYDCYKLHVSECLRKCLAKIQKYEA